MLNHKLLDFRRQLEQQDDRSDMAPALSNEQDSADNHPPQLWASAGLSAAAATAASSLMPRISLPKKISISTKRTTFTPHSSLDQPLPTEVKHIVVSRPESVYYAVYVSLCQLFGVRIS